ncbi:MutS2 family protein [Natronincola peptidivorans]|uniref:MutS2 family protein n=1 Tax=Natronincola peptidivorans TaxID=426128 RepID=A0A1I0DD61_9FIRM|nr:DNA mismatch repair protein [Natronincola peptidivorans]SET30266.1 MutS2 family protein [Natronincola peptidivorans]
MNKNPEEILEFHKIIETLGSYTLSDMGRKLVERLQPSIDIEVIEQWMLETTEAKKIVEKSASIPLHSLQGIEGILEKLGKNNIFQPKELESILELLMAGKRVKKFMMDKSSIAPLVSSYALSIYEIKDITEEIDRCIRNGRVDDRASTTLAKTRKKIIILEERLKSKLESILKSPQYAQYLQENLISMRNGRYVIPVKREYRKSIDGEVLDSSSTGSTVFVEPKEVKKYYNELSLLKIEEEQEEYKILSYLTSMVESYEREIRINVETLANYDFLFAKGKYSCSIKGNSINLNQEGYIHIESARHPLLGPSAVPLDFMVGKGYKALVITGPNTGGKTVTIKTIGLLTLMAQSGLHVPAKEESQLAVFDNILVDIGDGQSIQQSLSTFSSHIENIITIVEEANERSLVIMDELGAGTDPAEGTGLAAAILETVYNKGATILATTHYSEIKSFAENHKGFKNGCMEFDIHSLKPLYKLHIGESGESNAFLIALRLGLNKGIIERAHEITYGYPKEYDGRIFEKNVVKVATSPVLKPPTNPKKKNPPKKAENNQRFKLGDCVYVSSLDATGIVYEEENSKGEVGVMVKKKKLKVNKKRLTLHIDGRHLYPEDYDLDIVFESKDNRKKKKLIGRKLIKGVAIEYTDES